MSLTAQQLNSFFTMHRANIINRVVFDIRTDAGIEVLNREEPFEDFVCTGLIPVVDEVLRTHSTSGALISIASLEIDLGTLEHENICEKMAERLRERLDAAIRDKIQSLQGVSSRQEGVFTEPEATCRLIEQFLSTGTVPWATDPGAELPLSRLLRNALASHGQQFVAFLKRSAPRIRKRLIRQFPAHDLIALVQLLAPDYYRLVIEAVNRVQQSTTVIQAGGETAAHLAWDLVFDYLLDRGRERFSPDEFVSCLISGIAVATGTNTARLVRELTALAPKLDVASERRSGLQALLTGLKGDDARDGNEVRTDDFERLKGVLVNMLEFGATSGFNTAWEDLLLYYPDPTSTVIREHGKKSVVRKRIATSFSDPQIREVIRLIEPENSEFIEAFADQSALIADDERVRPPDRSVHKKQIREFVLTYLLVDRGSRFNEKAFTGSVIQQLAAHYNWTYRRLLTSLREASEMTQPPGPMKERIFGIVTELETELENETQLRKEPAPESRRQIRGTDLYAFLELHLMGEAVHETIPGDPLSILAGRTIQELQRDHPEILLRLFKVLQNRPDAVRRAAGRLSADRLEQLATIFPVLVSSYEKKGQRELQAAIARWADRAPDRHRYFVAVLDAVVRGELIDLEAIVAEQQKHTVLKPATGVVADPPLTASYLIWFLTLPPTDSRERALYRSLLDRFITDSPQTIGRYLIGMIKEPSLCAAFVQLTPWRLIRKAMAAMAGFTDAKRYVAILEGVFRPGIPAARCRPADFVKIVIDVLSEKQHADGKEFLKTAFGRLVEHTGDAAARERAVHALEKMVSAKGAALRSIAAHYCDTTNLALTGDKASADTQAPRETIEMTPLPEASTGAVADPPLTASYLIWFLTLPPTDPQERALYRSLLDRFITDSPQAVGRYLIGMIKEPSLCAAFMQLTPWRLIRKAMAAMAGFTDARRYVAILEGVFRPGTPAARCRPADFVKIVIDVLSEQQHADGKRFLKTAFGRLVARTGDAAAGERAVHALEKIVSTKGAGLRSIAAHYRGTTDLVPTGDKASADTQAPEEAAVLAYLKGDGPALPPSIGTLKKSLEAMILHTPEKLYWFIAEHLDRGSMAEKLVALLSEPFRVRLLHILIPRHFGRAQRYVDLLRNAAYGTGSFDYPDEVNQRIWHGAFTYLRETGLWVFDERAFVRRMVEFLAENRKNTDRACFCADLGQQLAADIQPSTRADRQILIRIVSEAAQQTRLSESVPTSPQTQPAGTASVLNDEKEIPWNEEIYIANAGMVIAAPYLPRLFELLGLTEQSRFTSREAAERGVHLLQYMVDERTGTPEYQLVLNKLLCGVKPGIPIVRGIKITDKETEAITNMITAMIQNWKILGNTSIAGFRESFFQRKARLTRKNDAWHLQVEERAFDMLLDQIPWSFSTIKYSWMKRVIFVKWRE